MIASGAQDDAQKREIARGLAAAVHAAVASARAAQDGTHSIVWGAATGVADLLELPGLAALLVACESHADAPPLAVANMLDRLSRLATDTGAQGDIAPFVAADRELDALAGVLSAQDWVADGGQDPTPVAVQSLDDVLADFELDDPSAVAQAQLTLQVAAGLRAALDWLGADAGGPLRVTVQDGSLTLALRVMHEPGLAPAGAVLGLMSGALLPEPDGRWLLRVPLQAPRPAFLLARQGDLALAVPWHAVARLRIADDVARAGMTEPSLAPWSPLARERGERPAVLIAQGLSRAWLHLDHIVWRVFASPEPGQAPVAVPGSRWCVRSEDGAEYWVVDMAEALRGVPPVHTPPLATKPRARAIEPAPAQRELPPTRQALPAPAPAPAPAHAPAPAPAPGGPPIAELPPASPVLTRDQVRPLSRAHASDRGPALEPTPAPFELDTRDALPPAPVVLDANAVRPLVAGAGQSRRALVVDDSLVARMALTRALEREGFAVEGVDRAEEMWTALRDADWAVVFVDVGLPDTRGPAHLRALVAQKLAARHPFEIVALTRDGVERQMAREAGIERALRKPFAVGALAGLIRELSAERA